jgi:hypothetical protein
MKPTCIVIGFLLFFTSCKFSNHRLTYRDVELQLKDDTCQTNNCTNVSFRYVKFEGEAADSLNKIVDETIGAFYFNDSFSVDSPKETAQKFIAVYKAYRNEFPENEQTWILDKVLKVDTLFENVVTLRFDESSYTGGAHGSYYTQFNHFQLKPFRILWLADFLNHPQDTFQLIKIAESVFREKEKLGAYDDLKEAGFFFENGIFRLNENFHFTKDGMEFQFNIYEIQPYSAGDYQLLIPYNKIAHLLNKKLL